MTTVASTTRQYTLTYQSGHNKENKNCSKYSKQRDLNRIGEMGNGRVKKQTEDSEAQRLATAGSNLPLPG